MKKGIKPVSTTIPKRVKAANIKNPSRLPSRFRELMVNDFLNDLASGETESQNLKEKLSEFYDYHAALVSEIPDILMEVNTDKKYVWANEAGYQFFGNDVIGKESSFYFEDDQDIYSKVEEMFTGSDEVFEIENWQRRKDGEKRLLSWRCRTLKDAHGNISGAISIAHDITDSIRNKEELRRNEEKYRKLVEFSPDAIVVHCEGKIIFVNAACLKMMGAESENDLLGKIALDFVHPDYKDVAMERIRGILQENRKAELFYEKFIDLKGNIIDVETTAIPFSYDGKPAIQLFIRDISDQLSIEDQLANEKMRLLEIIRGTNAGTWEWNMKTGETIFNDKWAEIIGFKLEELEPTNLNTFYSMVHPDDVKISDEALKKHINGETLHYECEVRMKHKDGHWIWILDRGKINKWDEEGNPLYMSGTHQEITERKIAEEKIKLQLEELKRWHDVTLGREDRIRQLKQEVNELLIKLDEPLRYPSQINGKGLNDGIFHDNLKLNVE